MFNLVRRDGARENSGHFEALKHDGTSVYQTGQVVANDEGEAKLITAAAENTAKPYGIVARDEDATGKEVMVLRIMPDMEFEAPVTDAANLKNAYKGYACAISTDAGKITIGNVALDTGKLGAEISEIGDGKVTVRFTE